MNKMLRDAWKIAIMTLCEIEKRGVSERLAMQSISKQLVTKDAYSVGLAYKLTLETTRRQNYIDYIIRQGLKDRSINEFPPKIRAFLRLYTYDLTDRSQFERVDYERAIKIASIGRQILGWRSLKQAEKIMISIIDKIRNIRLKSLNDVERIALNFFQQYWFVKYCFKLLGRHEAIEFFRSTLSNQPAYIRLNTLLMKEDKILEHLKLEEIILEKIKELKHTYKVVKKEHPLPGTKSFEQGLFYIQDKASCIATEIANPKPNMVVLDACAAPGAKTTHFAQLMENKGIIYSFDYSKRRMKVWKRQNKRMGVEISEPIISDLYNKLPLKTIKVDLAFVDPPCTGTGTFSRIPSAKWRLSKRSIKHMANLQWKILNNCSDFLKEDGTLVYSTCSITLEENEMLIERFLKLRPDFRLVPIKHESGLPGFRGLAYSKRLFPHIHDCNGFFIAKLTRKI